MSSETEVSENDNNEAEMEEQPLKSKSELRCVPLQNALKSFVVESITKHYSIAAIRALMKPNSKDEIWIVRQKIEKKFATDKHIVAFISCGTALSTKIDGENKELPGISFYVIFDWPECGIGFYESYLSKMVMETGLDIYNCKALRGRSK